MERLLQSFSRSKLLEKKKSRKRKNSVHFLPAHIQTVSNQISSPSLRGDVRKLHHFLGEGLKVQVHSWRDGERESDRRCQKVSESSESFSVVPSLEGLEGFLGLRGARGPVLRPFPPWWGSCLSRAPGEGAPERSHPPSERLLLETEAPGPPSSDRCEPPGGEESAELHS